MRNRVFYVAIINGSEWIVSTCGYDTCDKLHEYAKVSDNADAICSALNRI